MTSSFLAFVGVSALVIVTPGPDTAVTIRNTLFGGRTAGVLTALGVAIGQVVWALATSFGIVALLIASEPLFLAVKYAGPPISPSSASRRYARPYGGHPFRRGTCLRQQPHRA